VLVECAVAALRGDSVSEGFLALFGPAARRAFFRAAVVDRDTFGFVAEDGEGITAFVLVTTSARRIERSAVLGNPHLLPRVFATGLRSPTVLARALRRFIGVAMDRRPPSASAEPALRLLDIVVANRARRRGHGRAILAATLAEAWSRGHDAIGLSVLTANGDLGLDLTGRCTLNGQPLTKFPVRSRDAQLPKADRGLVEPRLGRTDFRRVIVGDDQDAQIPDQRATGSARSTWSCGGERSPSRPAERSSRIVRNGWPSPRTPAPLVVNPALS